jgi:cystathionine beta-lyase
MSDPNTLSPSALSTVLIHHPYQAPAGFEAPQQPVHKASTVLFPDVAAVRSRRWLDKSSYTYGLHGTPTSFVLEERLCALEGARQCLLVPSGLSALSTVSMALLSAGDEVLLPDNAYGPNKDFAQVELARWGITHRFYDPMSVDDLRAKMGAQTRLVWLEAAGSVTMEFPDLLAQVRLCKERGVVCALDNTWGAGLAFAPFDLLRDGGSLGVDVSVHALTKYPSGGGDVLMGSITTCDQALHMRIKLCHMRLGLGVGANDVELVLRSLPSIALRYHAQDRTARTLAQALQRQSAVVQVLHPALAGAPGHAHWQQVCGAAQNGQGAAAGIFSFVVDARFDQDAVDAFCNRLRWFRLGYSWGGHMSLVMPYDLDDMRHCGRGAVAAGRLVRLCIGLEDAADLERDLAQAYEAAFGCAWMAA